MTNSSQTKGAEQPCSVQHESSPAYLCVEYRVGPKTAGAVLAKRDAMMHRVESLLKDHELGVFDGAWVSSKTVEASFEVIDYARAKGLIEADLAQSEFSDYSRIYRED